MNWNMIDIILSGKKTIIDVSNITSLETGELMLSSKGSYLIHQALPENGLFKSIVLYFTNDFLTDFLIKYDGLLKNEKQIVKTPYLVYQQDPFIKNYVSSLQELMLSLEINSIEFKLIKVEELLLYLLRTNPKKLLSLSVSVKDDADMAVKKAAESAIGTQNTVEELAFLCNMSLSTFKRRFIKLYGLPPQKWMVQQKMLMAANLLKHPDERSGSIFEKLGYENQSSFIKAFKQQYGITPKAFQEAQMPR